MPYKWTDTPTGKRLCLRPHRSLPRRGFAAIIMMAFTLIIIPLFGLLGTVFLWGLLPFVLITIAGLWWGLEHTYKTAEVRETLILTPTRAHLTHQPRKGAPKEWHCNTYWVRTQMYPTGGPVAFYVTLKGNGREVEIGSFLSEDERKVLIGELKDALRDLAAPKDPPA